MDDAFGIIYEGTLYIPRDDQYHFKLDYAGSAALTINKQELITTETEGASADVSLRQGSYPTQIIYFKNENWQPPRLGLFVWGTNTHRKALHASSSLLPGDNMVSPILVKAGSEPRLLRAFLDFKGAKPKRLTHTIAVGEPGGIHYIYNLQAGNLACVWRGDFIDATPMWHQRGDGSFRPLGITQYLLSGPALAELATPDASFPDSSGNDFRSNGYSIVEGRPLFDYSYKGAQVTDKVYPDSANKFFVREVAFKDIRTANVYFKLAEGSDITALSDGSWAVDDRKFLVRVLTGQVAMVRGNPGNKELVLKVDGSALKYSITW